jgi:hypothetical protein
MQTKFSWKIVTGKTKMGQERKHVVDLREIGSEDWIMSAGSLCY